MTLFELNYILCIWTEIRIVHAVPFRAFGINGVGVSPAFQQTVLRAVGAGTSFFT